MRTSLTSLASTLFICCAGACGTGVSPSERDVLAVAYAEALLARHLHPGDSTATTHAIDSSLRTHGIDGGSELKKRMEDVAEQSDAFRALIDSAQHYLERVRNGKQR